MTVFPASGPATGAAVVVFPGGGYRALAIDLEGTEVCDWLTPLGITCAVLKYRVPGTGPHWDEACRCHRTPAAPLALQDAQRAVGLLRAQADRWGLDPRKIGVLGFSAGGHLVADLSTHHRRRAYPAVDAADAVACRPDFAIVLYPGHMLEGTTGPFELNPTLPVDASVPPTLLVHAQDDPVDDVKNTLVYYTALQRAGVPTELHLYATGGHAFGLRPQAHPITAWPRLAEAWLRSLSVLPPP